MVMSQTESRSINVVVAVTSVYTLGWFCKHPGPEDQDYWRGRGHYYYYFWMLEKGRSFDSASICTSGREVMSFLSLKEPGRRWETLFAAKPNTPHEVLLNSPKLSLQFPCKQIGRIWFFILYKLVCMITWIILITKQLILMDNVRIYTLINWLGLKGLIAIKSLNTTNHR